MTLTAPVRNVILIATIAVLVLLNLWKWGKWGVTQDLPEEPLLSITSYKIEDFRIPVMSLSQDNEEKFKRDLFQAKITLVNKPIKKAPLPKAPPPKTPEQLEEEAARAEFAQYKYVGVVFRGGKGQAYLMRGDQTYLVTVGENAGTRFRVTNITPDSLRLMDPITNVSGDIPISGK